LDYCGRLLYKFSGMRVIPAMCPMIPCLDPGSTFFCHPEDHGYRVFYRTVEEHRRGMQRPSIIGRTNYETRWLSRSDLVCVGFRAVAELMQMRAGTRQLPSSLVGSIRARIDDAIRLTQDVERVDGLADPERARALAALGDEIERRNREIFFAGVANQAYPVARQVGHRWFDELGWRIADLDRICSGQQALTVP
jgi:clorobiocin biosynthesis protein CloN6